MPTARGRWGSKLVLRLLFKNTKNEKQRSSSTLVRTWTTAIFANLMYLGKECVRTWDASTIFQICVNGLRTKGCSMVALELLFSTTWTFLVHNQVDDNSTMLEPPCWTHPSPSLLIHNTMFSECPSASPNSLHNWVPTNIEDTKCPWH